VPLGLAECSRGVDRQIRVEPLPTAMMAGKAAPDQQRSSQTITRSYGKATLRSDASQIVRSTEKRKKTQPMRNISRTVAVVQFRHERGWMAI
jgi:hypothetical protein